MEGGKAWSRRLRAALSTRCICSCCAGCHGNSSVIYPAGACLLRQLPEAPAGAPPPYPEYEPEPAGAFTTFTVGVKNLSHVGAGTPLAESPAPLPAPALAPAAEVLRLAEAAPPAQPAAPKAPAPAPAAEVGTLSSPASSSSFMQRALRNPLEVERTSQPLLAAGSSTAAAQPGQPGTHSASASPCQPRGAARAAALPLLPAPSIQAPGGTRCRAAPGPL